MQGHKTVTHPIPDTRAGFTALEMVIYAGVLALIVVGVVQAVLTMSGTFGRLKATRALTASAAIALDRFVFEVREAASVDTDPGDSTFNAHPGMLTVVRPDLSTAVFSLDGPALLIDSGSGSETLTSSSVSVNNLVFRHLSSISSEAVRMELTLEAFDGETTTSETFYTTAVLRGSYSANQ